MNIADKPEIRTTDIDLGELLNFLAATRDMPLIFHYQGNAVRPGYHVTEVKAGSFSALDCGANPESWSEIFVQLWDIDEGERTHMPAAKFSAIIRKVSEHVRLADTARLTFEVSDGIEPMRLFCAARPLVSDGAVHIDLLPRAASCKPRDRWLAEKNAEVTCCGPSANPCCGQG